MPRDKTRAIYWAIVFALGFLQAWSHRFQVDHDGVNYLDVADQYARGAWSGAINGYWSPLYSWLLALGDFLLRFPRTWESTFLHLINFVAYLCAYRCFEFFLKELLQARQSAIHHAKPSATFSGHSWRLLGLGLFLYSSLYMANHAGSTPDVLLALFAYLAMGLLLGIWSGRADSITFACFGATLAFGYFAKTAMFPLAFVFLAVAAVLAIRQPKKRLPFLLAPICFLLIAGPWVAALSHAKGRFTFGDSGRLNYARHVQPAAVPFAWSGQTDAADHLAHPPRRLGDDPPVIEFARPLPGTFPLWYDTSYWLEGKKVQFSWHGQFRVLRLNATIYLQILNNQREYLVLLLLPILLEGSVLAYFRRLLGHWPVLLPPSAAMGMYALVFLEPRYVAPYVVILWLGLCSAVQLPESGGTKLQQFVHAAILGVVLVTGVGLARGAVSDAYSVLRPRPNEQLEVAEGLEKLGLSKGLSVSLIGTSRESFEWARLAGLRIVSIVPNENVNQFWFGSPDAQEKVRAHFTETGSVAIITDDIPPGANSSGWQRIGQSSYSIYRLPAGLPR